MLSSLHCKPTQIRRYEASHNIRVVAYLARFESLTGYGADFKSASGKVHFPEGSACRKEARFLRANNDYIYSSEGKRILRLVPCRGEKGRGNRHQSNSSSQDIPDQDH